MKLNIKKGQTYFLAESIFRSWKNYRREVNTPCAEPDTFHQAIEIGQLDLENAVTLDYLATEHINLDKYIEIIPMYVVITEVKQISEQFVLVKFDPMDRDLWTRCHYYQMTIFDDTQIKLPYGYDQYLPASRLELEFVQGKLPKVSIDEIAEFHDLCEQERRLHLASETVISVGVNASVLKWCSTLLLIND